jgi:mono/diheme cytochrome c family protein
VLLLAGCQGVLPPIDWQQMNEQPKLMPYDPSSFFFDGRAMRPLPDGSVPRDAVLGRPALTEGTVDGKPVTAIPIALDRARLEKGRARFEVICAACHGLDGSGESAVAMAMQLRKPPSLLTDENRAKPPGRVFQIASDGYGLMPSYRAVLPVEERWEVVGYLKVLQLSRGGVRLDALPPATRAAALRALAETSP